MGSPTEGVPLGFHHLPLFFLCQGLVVSLSPYPFFLLLFLLGLGFKSIFFSPQHTRGSRVLGFVSFAFYSTSYSRDFRIRICNGFFNISMVVNSVVTFGMEVVVAQELLRIEATQSSEVVQLGAHQTRLRQIILALNYIITDSCKNHRNSRTIIKIIRTIKTKTHY